jgi:hypothetical protein
MANKDQNHMSAESGTPRPGPFLARVVSHQDPTYMGVLTVEILRPSGSTSSEGELHQVKYMSPFYGVTKAEFVNKDPDDYNNAQKSYGMWMIPPDTGTTVVIFFIDGDPKRGYWMGSVLDTDMNHMLPGIAATENNVEGGTTSLTGDPLRAPVSEYNNLVNKQPEDGTKVKKPQHPLTKALQDQGLIEDDIRGITTSSARREVPSMVFGISTPGPLDKQDGTPTGKVGTEQNFIPNYPASRLGGTTFVMDDGDDKFIRKTKVTEGPPEYVAVSQGETGGEVTIPHNELFRIRTRTGHQILMHNSEDLIYITNSRGTSWIEMSSDGKIDIFATDSISVHTGNDLNFYADRDINFEAGRNFNLKVKERHQTEVGKDKITIVNGKVAIKVAETHDETIGGQANITVAGGFDLNTSGTNKLTSGGTMEIGAANTTISGGSINLNGPAAASAGSAAVPEPLSTFDNPTEKDGTTITSIMLRVPTTEPYPHHENLDATKFTPDATDRESGSAIAIPDFYKKYTTSTDPFNKVKGPDNAQ